MISTTSAIFGVPSPFVSPKTFGAGIFDFVVEAAVVVADAFVVADVVLIVVADAFVVAEYILFRRTSGIW